MINLRACANSAALTSAIVYVACTIFVVILPGAYMSVMSSWSHGMDLSALYSPVKVFNVGATVLGLVTFTAMGWLVGALFAWLYNKSQSTAAK